MTYNTWKNKVSGKCQKSHLYIFFPLHFPQLQVVLCFETGGFQIALPDLMQVSEMSFFALWTGTETNYKLQNEVIHKLFSSYIFKPSLDQTIMAALLHVWEICIANMHNCKAVSQTSYPALFLLTTHLACSLDLMKCAKWAWWFCPLLISRFS